MEENSTSTVNILFAKVNKVQGNIIIMITFINIFINIISYVVNDHIYKSSRYIKRSVWY